MADKAGAPMQVIEQLIATYKRLDGSIRPSDVMQRIQLANEIAAQVPLLQGEAADARIKMLKDLGAIDLAA